MAPPSQTKSKKDSSKKDSSKSKPSTSSSSSSASTMPSTSTSDARFAAIASDPRYRLPSAKHARVNVDKRFSRMFRDDDFNKKASVDRYGRRVAEDKGKTDLKRFYRVDGDEEDEDDDDDDEVDDDGEVAAELQRLEPKGSSARDYARQGGFSDSSSDEDSEDEEADSDDDEDDDEGSDGGAVVRFPDEDRAPEVPLGEVSKRLAVVNLDWDNIRAADLMAVAQSFAPSGGRVARVVVYPSEFGKERIEREELEGPPREIFTSSKRRGEADDEEAEWDDAEDSEDEDEKIKKQLLKEDTGEEFDSARLRQYQLDRLKYYYAVITCDSEKTAKALYDDMDGREYLTTANFFDLRFVPDDVSFDADVPRDQCDKLSPGYKPNEFVTDALTHSKVKLTWDADDTTRKEVQKRAFSRAEIDENDLQAYIGSDSDSDDQDVPANDDDDDDDDVGAPKAKPSKAEAQRQKMRAALGLSTEAALGSKKSKIKTGKADAAPVGDMQVTFTSGLSGSKKNGVFENEPLTNESTREKYIRKEKERKQRRKDKAKAVRMGIDPDTVGEGSPEPEEAAAADGAQQDLGFDDPFFTDAPTAQKAEKEARKAEKAKKREEREAEARAAASQRAELELLMVDDKADASMRHFDMAEIAKAEKAKKRGGKKGKGNKGGDDEANNGAPKVDGMDFEIQTEDPRFKALFESHEYAIDPTNPRYQNTAGMKALLEEGRKKRKSRVDDDGEEGAAGLIKEKKAKKDEDVNDDGEDLQKLLARVKAKTKKR